VQIDLPLFDLKALFRELVRDVGRRDGPNN
jgi:hypothetical protein